MNRTVWLWLLLTSDPRGSPHGRALNLGRFLLDARNRHRHNLTQMQQPRQMSGVTGIGLNPVPKPSNSPVQWPAWFIGTVCRQLPGRTVRMRSA